MESREEENNKRQYTTVGTLIYHAYTTGPSDIPACLPSQLHKSLKSDRQQESIPTPASVRRTLVSLEAAAEPPNPE
jgi:hypothetical protein